MLQASGTPGFRRHGGGGMPGKNAGDPCDVATLLLSVVLRMPIPLLTGAHRSLSPTLCPPSPSSTLFSRSLGSIAAIGIGS